jgi:glycine cleavage system H protein
MHMQIPKDLKYTKTHEWVRLDGEHAVMGITDYAQQQLSDLTYVELPAEGDAISAQDEVAVVESVKAASDLYAPASGTVVEVNQKLNDKPELINTSPYDEGWILRFKPDDVSEIQALLDADQYEELLPDDA